MAGGELPPTVALAYDFAAATAAYLGASVAAWKLGATTAATRRTFATGEVYFGGLLADEIWSSTESAAPPAPPVLRGEAEIAFRLAEDIASQDGEAMAEHPASQLFDAWTPAIESPYSCVDNLVEIGLRALLTDRCAAGALYLGAPRPDVKDIAIEHELEIHVNGSCIAQGSAKSALLMTPVEAAQRFICVATAQGANLKRGQWISTGGITPCVPLPFNHPVELLSGGQNVFTLTVQAPTP